MKEVVLASGSPIKLKAVQSLLRADLIRVLLVETQVEQPIGLEQTARLCRERLNDIIPDEGMEKDVVYIAIESGMVYSPLAKMDEMYSDVCAVTIGYNTKITKTKFAEACMIPLPIGMETMRAEGKETWGSILKKYSPNVDEKDPHQTVSNESRIVSMTDVLQTALFPVLVKSEITRNFPRADVNFYSFNHIYADYTLTDFLFESIRRQFLKYSDFQVIAGIESRGFDLGMGLAQHMGLPFVQVRKKGKLPPREGVKLITSEPYVKEYGDPDHPEQLQMYEIPNDTSVLFVDDVYATGKTMQAALSLVKDGWHHSEAFTLVRFNDQDPDGFELHSLFKV